MKLTTITYADLEHAQLSTTWHGITWCDRKVWLIETRFIALVALFNHRRTKLIALPLAHARRVKYFACKLQSKFHHQTLVTKLE